MIIFGTGSKVLKQTPFTNHICNHCGSDKSYIAVTGSYAHIFWVPVFPYRKKLKIVCASCGQSAKAKNLSPQVKRLAPQLKSSVKYPVWMFVGLIVIVGGIGMLALGAYKDNKNDLNYIQTPEVNDVYFIRDKDDTTGYDYSIWKVNAVKGDSVYVASNAFYYMIEVYQLAEDDGFYQDETPVHKDRLLELYESNEITDVRRGVSQGFLRELGSDEENPGD